MNYFPISLASGKAFCNRKEELQRVHYNLENGTPTLLVSPRRYGKTSLALKAINDIQWPYAHIDLYKALSEEDIARFILNGIGQVLGQIESTPEKLMKAATEFFGGFQLKFVLEKYGLAVEFGGREKKKPIELILAALEKLDAHAEKRKQQVIIFLDEFQTLAEVVANNAMEAAIREAVQKSKLVRYIFSGSNRHLIEAMFNDKKRPFYKLCDSIVLGRINETDYKDYINKAALKKWHQPLPEELLQKIFQMSECHSYYVNKLCSLLWQQVNFPSAKEIEDTWQQYLLENESSIERELSLLSLNQRKVLIHLANEGPLKEPFGKQHATEWNMSATSIHRAMEILLEKDYVFVDSNGNYGVLDPLIRNVLQQI